MGRTVVAAERVAGGAVDHGALAARVLRLEADPPIPLASVDLTVANPGRVRAELGEVLGYFAAVEGDVAQNVADILALLPGLSPCERRFLRVWSAQEAAHSAIFDALRQGLGLEPAGVGPVHAPRPVFRISGALAEVDWPHDVLKLVYLTRGAMHERLTHDAYQLLCRRLQELGEDSLARITQPIRRQEAAHLGYYRLAAQVQRRRMTQRQLRWARTVSARSYAPVGAAQRRRRAQCGRVFAWLTGEDMEGALVPVQSIADTLLGDGVEPPTPFVHRAMARCLTRAGHRPSTDHAEPDVPGSDV